MKREILLSIVAASLLSATAYAAPQDAPAATTSGATAVKGGGKCASGKCGTEKIYGRVDAKQDTDGQLMRARDGKCGLSGKGFNVVRSDRDRMAEGVCSR